MGLWAADRSCKAPPSLVRPSISSPCLLLFDRPGDSVPPKEPPSLRCEMPPPKHLAAAVSEPDPDCFFTLLLFVVRSISNDCASPILKWVANKLFLFFRRKPLSGI